MKSAKKHKPANLSFLANEKVELAAPQLLGMRLACSAGGIYCAGKIVEVEAYCGRRDRACHAYHGKTKRNSILFEEPGAAYVYLCYGLHHLFNIVTGSKGNPCAVLIRAIEPEAGLESMLARRSMQRQTPALTNGPGKLAQALGINVSHSGVKLNEGELWLEEGVAEPGPILRGPRIGIDYAGEDKYLPWRFALDSPCAGFKNKLS